MQSLLVTSLVVLNYVNPGWVMDHGSTVAKMFDLDSIEFGCCDKNSIKHLSFFLERNTAFITIIIDTLSHLCIWNIWLCHHNGKNNLCGYRMTCYGLVIWCDSQEWGICQEESYKICGPAQITSNGKEYKKNSYCAVSAFHGLNEVTYLTFTIN